MKELNIGCPPLAGRYDKMRRWPTGLLAIGDAICSFNPIYGQGMTVAALESKCLQDCLLEGSDHLQRRYFRATANDYLKHAQAASRSDAFVAHRLTRVAGLIDAPIRLLHPEVAARVAVAGLKRRRAAVIG